VVLEVGPGIGTLTVALCDRASAVVAVERDADLMPALKHATAECDRFEVVRADAVAVEMDELSRPFGPPVALIANLPYAVAATVVLRLFEELDSMQSATVMVQSEVADRMAAQPGTKAYGAYSIKLRLRATPAGRFGVPRTCFMPPPRVDSAVLRLERAPLCDDPELVELASRVADASFAQRRKTIRNSLRGTLEIDVALIDEALEAAGIDGAVRAETLLPERFLALATELGARGL
jgi:16S rRNA (adenine1518-N6/adenine1519-N6)-dimethyltransferase